MKLCVHTLVPAKFVPAVLSSERLFDADREQAPYRAYVYAACTVQAILLNYVLGKDMAWDLLNYHFYDGFSALNNRFDQDYFAAGSQAYFNPYSYIPFYALVRLGLSGLAVGTILAAIHSVAPWLTYELAWSVSPSAERGERLLIALFATVLAVMNPILLQQIGSSFSKITTAGFVLGGWLLLARAVRWPRTTPIILGEIFLGFAAAQEITARHGAEVVLNRLETCPALFQPSRPQTEHVNQTWLRFYGATDLTAYIAKGQVKFVSGIRNPQEVFVGSEDAWARGPVPLVCGRHNEIYHAKLMQPSQ
jgi:hypothetical protein